jgi:DNA-binding transcriptional ArsR family regulator
MLAQARIPGRFGALRQRALEHGMEAGAIIGEQNRRRIVRALESGEQTIAALMTATFLSEGSVRRALSRLLHTGTVERRIVGPKNTTAPVYRLKPTEDPDMATDKPTPRLKLADVPRAAALAEERAQVAKFAEPDAETVAMFERNLPGRVAQLLAGKTNGVIAGTARRALDAIDRELRALNVEP